VDSHDYPLRNAAGSRCYLLHIAADNFQKYEYLCEFKTKFENNLVD
jgi:hypothetical protein